MRIGKAKVVLVPRSLQNYIDKIDYIKTRRPSPYAALDGIPETMSADGKKAMAEIAIKSYMQLSSVAFHEELAFDTSFEGFYFALWQGAKGSLPGWDKLTPADGVATAKQWFTALDDKDSDDVRLALNGIEQRELAKNSDGHQDPLESLPVANPLA